MKQLALSEQRIDIDIITKAVVKLMKQDILNRYKQTRKITDEDWEFCEQIDWHPVDELPMKKTFIEKLKNIEKSPHYQITIEDLDKLMGLK